MAEAKPKIELEESVTTKTVEKDWRLVSDPVDSLHREIQWTEKQRKSDYEHLTDLFKEATNARDRAIALLQDFANRTPTTQEVQGKVEALDRLTGSMFADVNHQLANIKTESNAALEKALQAQEKSASASTASLQKSIDKSENQFSESIATLQREQQSQRTFADQKIEDVKNTYDGKIEDAKKNFADMINEIRGRVSAAESRIGASEGQSKGADKLIGYVIAAVMALIAMGSLATMLLSAHK
jgi:hypothetical protein